MTFDTSLKTSRLQSLDLMRGLIMILLAAESCHLYSSLKPMANGNVSSAIVNQFFHHPWNGLRFWDLVQPAFMLMAGSAMYLSFHYKKLKGISWSQNLSHILIRCFKLFVFGTALHCIYAGELVWELWNVLTQLSITTLIAYLIIQRSALFQIIFSVALLVLTEFLYRYVHVAGFEHAFTEGENFGSYMDTLLMGKINSDGWVAINVIPTAAHTIWGVLAGRLLIGSMSWTKKIKLIVIAGLLGVGAGYLLDFYQITPIIKRISTSSFTLVSGGWVLLILALIYWITDIRNYNRYAWIFVVVGMNAIFIYLFFETIGVQWLNSTVGIFVKGFSSRLGAGTHFQDLLTSIVTLGLEWYLCYWLYKRKIIFKL